MTLHNPEFEIYALDTCPNCEGAGWETHPRWEQYLEETDGGWNENPAAWFNSKGWEMADQEVVCDECEGAGKVRKQVELGALVSWLFATDNHITGLCHHVSLLTNRIEQLEKKEQARQFGAPF